MGRSKKTNRVWKGMWLTLALEIWKHRNMIIFYNGHLDEVEIFARAYWSMVLG